MRRLKARQVAQILFDRATLLRGSLRGTIPEYRDFQDSTANHVIRNCIEQKSLEPALAIEPSIRAVVIGRMQAFILEYSKRPDVVVARVPADASDDDVLAASLSVLLPKNGAGRAMFDREVRRTDPLRGRGRY